jgi:hypothetical protein
MELILMAIVPAVAAFSVWEVVDDVSGRAAVLSQATGFPIDFGPSLIAFREPLILFACLAGVGTYIKARKWLRRKLSIA